MLIFPVLVNTVLKSLRAVRQEEQEIMGEQIENEDIKASFLTDHMILYINNPKHSTQKTLRNSFRKVAVYKINRVTCGGSRRRICKREVGRLEVQGQS